MSLLTSVNSGTPSQKYFVENIGGSGVGAAIVPCIKAGDVFNSLRIGAPVGGLIITGGQGSVTPLISGIQGGAATTAGGQQVLLGASAASFQNIVLTDSVTTINGTLAVPGGGDIVIGDNIDMGGNLTFTNGAAGKSISGQYAASTAVVAAGSVANPAGLTAGVYVVTYAPNTLAGNEGAEPSGVFVRTATQWIGNAAGFSFTAGIPNAALAPAAGSATLTLGGASVAVPGTLFYRKISN